MELIELETFLHIARERSLSKAAASLKVSQPTVSLRLKSLESQMSTALFDRAHDGMRLTPAGERLMPMAERILQLINETASSVQEDLARSRITVASVESVGQLMAADLLGELRSCSPGLHASLVSGHSHQVVQMVLDGAAKVGFIANTEAYSGLETVPLFSSPIRCVVRADHPLLERQPCSVQDLQAYAVVLAPWGARWRECAEWLISASGGQIQPWDISPTQAVKGLTEKGWVTFISHFHVEMDLAERRLAILSVKEMPAHQFTMSVIFRDRKLIDPVVREFLRLVAKRFPGAAGKLL